MEPLPITPRRAHLTRLMAIWRSAGWPCRDGIELDLLAAGWVRVSLTAGGHETLVPTDAGIRVLAEARQRNQRALSAHDRLAGRVAARLADAGRIVWRELSLRARADADADADADAAALPGLWPQPEDAVDSPPRRKPIWRVARPDVYSVRHTTVEAYLQPMVHEVKVSRADLLADLRQAAKGASYRWLSCETYYVFPAGVADPAEVPPAFGVWLLHGSIETGTLEPVRAAAHVPCALPFAVWMALARATPAGRHDEPAQRLLGEPDVETPVHDPSYRRESPLDEEAGLPPPDQPL